MFIYSRDDGLQIDQSINQTIHPDDDMLNTIKITTNGKEGIERYLISGKKNAEVFKGIIGRLRPSLLKGKRILDYGCGHGRVTRFLPTLFSPSKLVAADVWDSGVEFCSKELGTTPFLISKKNPISKFDDQFDIIIGISIFSHLPPKSFDVNMSELASVLAKDGLLLFTTHGDWYKNKFNLKLHDGYRFGTPTEQKAEPNANKLPNDEYGFMVVSDSFVQDILKRSGLRVIERIPQGHVGRQDLYVVENP